MPLSTQIYNRLPIFLQNVACSWRGRHLLKTRYNANFHRLLGELNESQWWELEKLQEYQNAKVRELMAHVYENVPYYNRVMSERGLTPKDFETAEDLKKMPYLTKDIIRREGKNMIAKNINLKKDAVFMHTSGTTGAGLKFWISLHAVNFMWAVVWRNRMRFGIHFLEPHANFGVNLVASPTQTKPPFWRENRPLRQTYCSIYHLSDTFLGSYVDMLEERKFIYFAGYPSALFSIADYMRRFNRTLPVSPKIIFTGAEGMLSIQKERIEKWMSAHVAPCYGLSEGSAFAHVCTQSSYHMDLEFSVMELKPIPSQQDNQHGIIVGTGLHNFAHPFIRYETNDIGVFSSEPCSCGLKSLVVKSIDGRVESYITTPDGRRVGLLDSVFKDMVMVRAAQLIQKTASDVLVKIVPEPDYDAKDEKAIIAGLTTYLGHDMNFTIEKVTEIPKTKSGKLRFVISEISSHLAEEMAR